MYVVTQSREFSRPGTFFELRRVRSTRVHRPRPASARSMQVEAMAALNQW